MERGGGRKERSECEKRGGEREKRRGREGERERSGRVG